MYFGKIAATVLLSAAMELPWFVLPASLFSVALLVRDTQAQSAGLSRMPLTSEMNDYTNAARQTDPAAKKAAVNAFLAKYPDSRAGEDLLEQLMAVYVREPDIDKVIETAVRILSLDPKNLRALFYITYATKERALSASPTQAQPLLDDAASMAQTALDAPSKPDYMSERDFEKLKAVSSPNFYSAIAIDDAAKRDYSGAIDNFSRELRAPINIKATESGFELDDTYRLAQAYEDQTPADLKNAAWFYTRAAQYALAKTKPQWEAKADSTYFDYHGSMDDYPEMQALARANVFPPSEYSPSRAIASRYDTSLVRGGTVRERLICFENAVQLASHGGERGI